VRPASLESRLVALQLVVAAVGIAVFAGSAIWLTARTLERDETRLMAATLTQISEALDREWVEEGGLEPAARAVIEEDSPIGIRVDLLDQNRQLVASTDPPAFPGRKRHRGAPERQVSRHIARGAWVEVTLSTAPRQRALAALATALAILAVPLFLAALASSRALARRALRPLSRMTAQAEGIATRDGARKPLGQPADPREVAALAAAFNRLLARLDTLLAAERHFTQDAAHELRTPLTVVSGELEYALADPGLPARDRDALRRAWQQSRELSDLVDALLLLRNADALRVGENGVPVNLSDVAREVTGQARAAEPARAGDLRLEVEDEVLVPGQAPLLAAAVRNLVSNALRFTAAGQPVAVSVSAGGTGGVLVVEDGGPGVRPDEAERIFDPFYRGPEARAAGTGFGLGLPLLRRVARAHGGEVLVGRSRLGGARFELRLPAWSREPAAL
jgi:signal transduction histidine kinase